MPTFNASYQKYRLIFKKPAGTSRGTLRTKDTFFLRLTDSRDPSRVGLGECGPLPGLSLDGRADFEASLAEVCAQLNRGQAPGDLELTNLPALAFGLEMALLDWQGGGGRRLFDTGFSRGQVGLPTHGLIWMADRANMLQQVHDKVAQGFDCIKLKVGALDFETECALLADIRRVYPAEQIELRLDANGAFTPDNVLERLGRLAQFQIYAIEQPLKPGQESTLAALCADSPIDIALDEELIGLTTIAAKKSLLATIKPQYIVLKPSLIGGFTAAEEWISLARHFNIGWWVNSMLESNLGLNAICQWVSALNLGASKLNEVGVNEPQTILTQGLGTGQLFTNNIPSPLRLAGSQLIYEPQAAWDISQIDA